MRWCPTCSPSRSRGDVGGGGFHQAIAKAVAEYEKLEYELNCNSPENIIHEYSTPNNEFDHLSSTHLRSSLSNWHESRSSVSADRISMEEILEVVGPLGTGKKRLEARVVANWARIVSAKIGPLEGIRLRPMWDDSLLQNSTLLQGPSFIADATETESDTSQKLPTDVVYDLWTVLSYRQPRHSKLSAPGHELSFWNILLLRLFFAFAHMQRFFAVTKSVIAWLIVGVIFLTTDFTLLSFHIFYGVPDTNSDGLEALEIAAVIYWTIDIAVSLGIGWQSSQALKRYFKGWFLFDFVLVMMQWAFLIIKANEVSGATSLRYFRIIRYCRLLRFAKIEQRVSELLQNVHSVWYLLSMKISIYVFCVCVYVHITATVWFLVGEHSENGWVNVFLQDNFDNFPLNYFTACGWAAAQLQGNTNIYPGNSSLIEQAYTAIMTIVSLVVMAALVGNLTTVLQQMQQVKSAKTHHMTIARRYLRNHEIDPEIATQVHKYMEAVVVRQARQQQEDEQELLLVLPRNLRRAVLLQTRATVVKSNLVFAAVQNINMEMFEAICCDYLEPFWFLPDEKIFSYGKVCKKMFMLTAGEVSYLRYSIVMQAMMRVAGGKQLNIGDSGPDCWSKYRSFRRKMVTFDTVVCEASLWVQWVHVGDLDSESLGTMWSLTVESVMELISNFPVVQVKLLPHANRFLRTLIDADGGCDLLDSREVFRRVP